VFCFIFSASTLFWEGRVARKNASSNKQVVYISAFALSCIKSMLLRDKSVWAYTQFVSHLASRLCKNMCNSQNQKYMTYCERLSEEDWATFNLYKKFYEARKCGFWDMLAEKHCIHQISLRVKQISHVFSLGSHCAWSNSINERWF